MLCLFDVSVLVVYCQMRNGIMTINCVLGCPVSSFEPGTSCSVVSGPEHLEIKQCVIRVYDLPGL